MKNQFRPAIADHLESMRLVPRYFIAGGFQWLCWDRAVIVELEQALADCNQAVSESPGDAWTPQCRGFVHLKLGRYAEALADYEAALAKKPSMLDALYGRGRARQLTGIDPAGAAADIAAARRSDPGIADTMALRGLPQQQ